jgi:hypothetical protein
MLGVKSDDLPTQVMLKLLHKNIQNCVHTEMLEIVQNTQNAGPFSA